jgi:PTH1 family peptidyl-tRNA hydrolase
VWVIIGLGNPGTRYRHTRHNVGFDVVDHIAGQAGITMSEKGESKIGKGTLDTEEVILIEPLTYMNLSGRVVKRFLSNKEDNAPNVIVVHDDIDMETGRLRVRRGGSAGGHKGVQSIIAESGTKDFVRVKIGIGRPEAASVEDYVLSRFCKKDRETINITIVRAVEAIEAIMLRGVEWTMNKYNRTESSTNL